jgi:NAD(P)-dependent dehydrogenase (short-subunit alcohol dehydrogenase family)
MMNGSFEGQVALVTGAAAGMGFATAKAFAEAGAAIALADLNQDALEKATDQLVQAGHKALAVLLRTARTIMTAIP